MSDLAPFVLSFPVPSRAPQNITFTNVESTKITVYWDPLLQQYANGKLLGYRVYFQVSAYYFSSVFYKNSVNVTATQVTLTGLKPGQRYDVSVSAFTSQGEGPRSNRHYVTTGRSTNKFLLFWNDVITVKPQYNEVTRHYYSGS